MNGTSKTTRNRSSNSNARYTTNFTRWMFSGWVLDADDAANKRRQISKLAGWLFLSCCVDANEKVASLIVEQSKSL